MFKALIGRGHPEFSTMRQQVGHSIQSPFREHPMTSLHVFPQDAQEFFLHLLSTIEQSQRTAPPGLTDPAHCFKYQVGVISHYIIACIDLLRIPPRMTSQTEERIECVVSGKVRYSKREDKLLALPVPMEMATNKSGWSLLLTQLITSHH